MRFCTGGRAAANQLGLPPAEIDEVSERVVSAYLNAVRLNRGSVRSMSAAIFDEFGLGAGPELVEPQPLGVVNIEYRRKVDRLRVGNSEMEPYLTILAKVGIITVSGLVGPTVVCQGSVTVRAIGAAGFVCQAT